MDMDLESEALDGSFGFDIHIRFARYAIHIDR